jgi:hypothetical protein
MLGCRQLAISIRGRSAAEDQPLSLSRRALF